MDICGFSVALARQIESTRPRARLVREADFEWYVEIPDSSPLTVNDEG